MDEKCSDLVTPFVKDMTRLPRSANNTPSKRSELRAAGGAIQIAAY
jgi:hypothetical protein